MAELKITDLLPYGEFALDDLMEIVDISDSQGGFTGTNKRATTQQLRDGFREAEVLRTDTSNQVADSVGYTGTSLDLTPGATEVPTPSAGQFRTLSLGETAIAPPAMTEVGFVSWTFDATIYSLDLSAYSVVGAPPAGGGVSIVFSYFGVGVPVATWMYEA